MNWYYVEQGQQAGPVEDAQLEEMMRSGKIQAETLVWREGMADWVPYSLAKGGSQSAVGAASAPATMVGDPVEAVCTECGGIFPKDNMIRHGNSHVCQNCKPIFMQKLSEGARIYTGALEYAGFWIRVLAKLVDNLIVGLVIAVPLIALLVIGFSTSSSSNFSLAPGDNALRASSSSGAELFANVLALILQFLVYGANIIYSTIFNGKYGATPGKMMCKLMVVDSDGKRIGYGRSFGRACAELLSNICSIGYIIAAFDSQKRTLHDHICNTRVVYK